MTEDDIENALQKFGNIVKVKVPTEEIPGGRKRNRGFAFVTFDTIETAERVLEEKEVTVEFATLTIERAMKRVMMPRDRDGTGFSS